MTTTTTAWAAAPRAGADGLGAIAARAAAGHPLTTAETAASTPHAALVEALRLAALELAQGRIACPPRQAVAMGAGGTLLSMIATSPDVTVHKLVSVLPANAAEGLPTLQGRVDVLDSRTGATLLQLDAATLTGRRTAALSMLGIATLRATAPACVLVIGTGAQALHHVLALRALQPSARIEILGRTHEATERFCAAHGLQGAHLESHADAPTTANAAYASALHPLARAEDSRADVVITCTTSRTPVWASPADARRLLVAVGAYRADTAEIAPDTVRASRCVVDEPEGARHEAGDLIAVGIDWSRVRSLAEVLADPRSVPRGEAPILFKTVGCAAWDLAAARVALAALGITP
jgi:1-piperideine-2-carboxylate/1-pyrroline-2-carboxylate reductase [NAD(P)H]